MESVIKKLREQNRYTQTKLAEILGISRPTLINYENMEQDIPIPIVKSLSKLFNVSYECIGGFFDTTVALLEDLQKQGMMRGHWTASPDLPKGRSPLMI